MPIGYNPYSSGAASTSTYDPMLKLINSFKEGSSQDVANASAVLSAAKINNAMTTGSLTNVSIGNGWTVLQDYGTKSDRKLLLINTQTGVRVLINKGNVSGENLVNIFGGGYPAAKDNTKVEYPSVNGGVRGLQASDSSVSNTVTTPTAAATSTIKTSKLVTARAEAAAAEAAAKAKAERIETSNRVLAEEARARAAKAAKSSGANISNLVKSSSVSTTTSTATSSPSILSALAALSGSKRRR